MSERQFKIYEFIVNYVKKNLYPPSLEEIAKATNLKSKSAVMNQLCNLSELGYIEVKTGVPRAIRLIGFSVVENS